MQFLQALAIIGIPIGLIASFIWAMEASSKATVASWIEEDKARTRAKHDLRAAQLARWNRVSQ